MKKVRTAVIIPAAGHGKRMNMDISKQYIEINDKPILAYTIEVFQNCPVIDDIIVVVGEEELGYVEKYIKDQYRYDKIKSIVIGGAQRQDSVYKGLQVLNRSIDYVMVHDGARPFITNQEIINIYEETKKYKACVLGVKVKDTIKQVDENKNVIDTPDRNLLYHIQTPQCFRKNLLLEAYRKGLAAACKVTDDATLIEMFTDTQVKIVEGSYDNIKITTLEDLEFMRHKLKASGNSADINNPKKMRNI